MTSAILDPTGLSGKTTTVGLSLAPRREDLTGATVGLLENGKQNARRFLEDVADILRERHGAGGRTQRSSEADHLPHRPMLMPTASWPE